MAVTDIYAMDRSRRLQALLRLLPVLLTAAVIGVGCSRTPKLEGRVTDLAGVFSTTESERISRRLADYENETSHQLAVLTVPTLKGEAIESFSLRVVNAWKLGRKGVNNGILVTLAMKERAARIELGLGFERYISDAKTQEIMNEAMIPAFARGEFAEGVERGLERLMDEGRKFVAPKTDAAEQEVTANLRLHRAHNQQRFGCRSYSGQTGA